MKPVRQTSRGILAAGILVIIYLLAHPGRADCGMELSKGQTVYVPIYSHIYTSPKSVPSDLTAILSIRNTDLKNSVTVVSVDYYDSEGKLIRQYLKTPLELKAMASTRYIVGTYDKEGGSGANFIVRWRSEKEVNAPLIESVMIGNRGLSFISRGQEISE